ncbi:MAG: hypothetical protein ACT4QC_17460 [Planctomycetaceae bacterium]
MQALELQCPHCAIRLRVKDPLSLGRQARCPDCRRAIVIVSENGAWRITAVPDESPPADGATPHIPAAPADPQTGILATTAALSVRKSPAFIFGLAMAAMALVLLIAWFFVGSARQRTPVADLTGISTHSQPEARPGGPAAERGLAAARPVPGDAARVPAARRVEEEADFTDLPPDSSAPSGAFGPVFDDDPPLWAELAHEPEPVARRFDIEVALRQPITSYELPRPRPVSDLLTELSEMVGAPIRIDPEVAGPAQARLKSPVQVRLRETTVGEILAALLKPAGLTYRVENDEVWLVPR